MKSYTKNVNDVQLSMKKKKVTNVREQLPRNYIDGLDLDVKAAVTKSDCISQTFTVQETQCTAVAPR